MALASERVVTALPIALTIAGSDSGGGAGIQADLKTFSALGAFGCSVITALTAQNTKGVTAISSVDPAFVKQQIDTVFEDIAVNAVKIGMLSSAAIIDLVAASLERWRPKWIVVDPVMVAKSGHRLLEPEAVTQLRNRLIPLATIITPNLPEAADLLGVNVPRHRDEMPSIATRLLELGPAYVLLKGGHLEQDISPDLLLSKSGQLWLEGARVPTRNTHGTGCTLSSAIAALLPQCSSVEEAVVQGKNYVHKAIEASDKLHVGSGHGPVHHFYHWWGTSDPHLNT